MKKLLKRLLVLLFIFVAAVAAVLFFTRNQEQETVYAVMSEATLPVVTMEFEVRGDNGCYNGKYTN